MKLSLALRLVGLSIPLLAGSAAASPVEMNPDPLLLHDSWEQGEMSGSVILLSGDTTSGELVFEVALAYTGARDPFLLPAYTVEFDFGPAEVGSVPGLEYLGGGPTAIFLSPCLPDPTCPNFLFNGSEPFGVRVTVLADPLAMPEAVTVTATHALGHAPFPVMEASATAQLAPVPEPSSRVLVALGLLLVVLGRQRLSVIP